jgi:hypothetical protein
MGQQREAGAGGVARIQFHVGQQGEAGAGGCSPGRVDQHHGRRGRRLPLPTVTLVQEQAVRHARGLSVLPGKRQRTLQAAQPGSS